MTSYARWVGEECDVQFNASDGTFRHLTAKLIAVGENHLQFRTADQKDVFLTAAAVDELTAIRPTAAPRSQKVLATTLADALAIEQPNPQARLEVLANAVANVENEITSTKTRSRANAVLDFIGVVRELENEVGVAPDLERRLASSNRRALPRPGFRATPGSLLDAVIKVAEEVQLIVDRRENRPNSLPDAVNAPPRIVTTDRVMVTRGRDNEFDLQVRIVLDAGSAPVSNIRLILDKFRNLKTIGAAPHLRHIQAGEKHTFRQRMRDNRKQGARGDVKIDAHLTFNDATGRARQSSRQTLDIRIAGKEQHQSIPNPFRAYAGGLPIHDSGMFFGRRSLVEELTRDLQRPPGGRCFALYGQQRTGKSSVMQQVERQLLNHQAVVASLSMGILDRRSLTVDFVEEVLDQWRVRIDAMLPDDLAGRLLSRWPDGPNIEKSPLKSLRRVRQAAVPILRSAGKTSVPFVVVVDEFTYLFEILRRRGVPIAEQNELRDFMRQLKSLLESRMFSALLIGQDTMPTFLNAFPNEFSVMATSRLEYLSPSETQRLADEPIRYGDGQSRYSGYALSTIAAYTDGHPYFTQILCDRIVTSVNATKRSEISDSDVEAAVESLLAGHERIEPHRFDCFVSADNSNSLISSMLTDDDFDGSAVSQDVLARIALLSGSQNHPVPVAGLDLDYKQAQALQDLINRGVLAESDAGVFIRVLLYADFLRRQRA